MTALRQEQRQSAPTEYTAEDVAVLARFMGWERMPYGWRVPSSGTLYVESESDPSYLPWNPFDSIEHAYDVLGRAADAHDISIYSEPTEDSAVGWRGRLARDGATLGRSVGYRIQVQPVPPYGHQPCGP